MGNSERDSRVMRKSKRHASDRGEETEATDGGRVIDRQVIGKSKRQASKEQSTSKYCRRARDTKVMRKSERQAKDRGVRDTKVMCKSKR